MRSIAQARLARKLDRGIELDCGEGLACRILLPAPGFLRVVFIPASGFREGRRWMVALGAEDGPWEGRDRLDLGDVAPVPLGASLASRHVFGRRAFVATAVLLAGVMTVVGIRYRQRRVPAASALAVACSSISGINRNSGG